MFGFRKKKKYVYVLEENLRPLLDYLGIEVNLKHNVFELEVFEFLDNEFKILDSKYEELSRIIEASLLEHITFESEFLILIPDELYDLLFKEKFFIRNFFRNFLYLAFSDRNMPGNYRITSEKILKEEKIKEQNTKKLEVLAGMSIKEIKEILN